MAAEALAEPASQGSALCSARPLVGEADPGAVQHFAGGVEHRGVVVPEQVAPIAAHAVEHLHPAPRLLVDETIPAAGHVALVQPRQAQQPAEPRQHVALVRAAELPLAIHHPQVLAAGVPGGQALHEPAVALRELGMADVPLASTERGPGDTGEPAHRQVAGLEPVEPRKEAVVAHLQGLLDAAQHRDVGEAPALP